MISDMEQTPQAEQTLKLTNAQLGSVLRRLAEVYEDNPDIPQLHGLMHTEFIFCMNKEEFTRTVAAFGPGRKDADSGDGATAGLLFFPAFAAGTGLRVHGFKDKICSRVQVGTRLVAEQPPQPERVIPAQAAIPAHEEPVFEWHCSPFLESTPSTPKAENPDDIQF